MRRTIFMMLLAVMSNSAMAEDVPSQGLVYNIKESHSITYNCEKNAAGKLDCEFIQTAVRKNKNRDELAAMLVEGRQEFRSGKQPVDAQVCKEYRDMQEIFEGRKKAPKPEGLASMTAMERRDTSETIKSIVDFCNSKTEENYMKFVRLAQSKAARTCRVSSLTFKQTFGYVAGRDANTSIWVAESKPEGVCGAVQLSRFTPERMQGFVLWKYVAKKAITNPDAIAFPGVNENIKCSQLDEAEYVYDWRSKEHPLQCDYIQFSVL